MRDLTVGGYLLCLLAAAVLVWQSHRGRAPLAPVGEVLDLVLASRAARVALVGFWWWLGWHFLVGQTVDPVIGG